MKKLERKLDILIEPDKASESNGIKIWVDNAEYHVKAIADLQGLYRVRSLNEVLIVADVDARLHISHVEILIQETVVKRLENLIRIKADNK